VIAVLRSDLQLCFWLLFMREVGSSSKMIVFVMIAHMTQSVNESDVCIDRQNCHSIDHACTASRGKKNRLSVCEVIVITNALHAICRLPIAQHNLYCACIFIELFTSALVSLLILS